MGQILDFVGQTILRALPTFIIVFLLYLYLKKFFFEPLGDVLEKRRLATEGAVQKAEALIAQAAERSAAYEQALADARAEAGKENEAVRQQLQADQAAALEKARVRASELIAAAKSDLAAQAEASRVSLEAESERLAEEIVAAVLGRRAA